ncbi:MAG TPA: FGGY-family carbohydrate kinase, partial [Fodinibius sp.]|nr:FGGY-family carbohydrate kinase [Fodinibius sp.]
FGTIDTWLLYRLTGGEQYLTDYTNACRTMLFNIRKLEWDSELLEMFGLKALNLPKVVSSCAEFGGTDFAGQLDHTLPIGAMAGDSHAAAFGERCYSRGTAKATLGTGCSILMNTGDELHPSVDGLIGTICWSTSDTIVYGLEGAIVSCGSTLDWLQNQLGLFKDTDQIREMAEEVASSEGVHLVPAFSGIGAPYWDMEARGVISGLTFGTSKNHIVRAALESISFQIKLVIDTVKQATGIELQELNADGGISKNRFIVQQLADLLEIRVRNLGLQDISAMGAALLAGLQADIYQDLDDLDELSGDEIIFNPNKQSDQIQNTYREWKKRVELELHKRNRGK